MEKLGIQPSELDMLPFYEYEYTVSLYNDIMKERRDKENGTASNPEYGMNMPSGIKSAMSSLKMPSMPSSIKFPKV